MISLQMHGRSVRFAAMLGAVFATNCGTSRSGDETSTGSTRQAIETAHPSYQVPTGADASRVLLSGSQRLVIYDRVTLGKPANSIEVYGGAPQRSEFAAGSRLNGNAWIGSKVFMGSSATITGNLRAASTLEAQAGASVWGQKILNSPVPATTRSWNVQLPESYPTQVVLEPGVESTAGPGAYATIDIRSNARLKVSSGNYFVQTLNLEPQSVLELDTRRGPVVFYVTGQVRAFRGQLAGANLAGQYLLVYLGTSLTQIETAFRGTVIAPNAVVDLRRPTQGKQLGSFYGKEVQVQSDAVVEFERFVSMDCLAGSGCSGHGTCSVGKGTQAFQCECTGDWVGDNCEINRPILPAHPTQVWSIPSTASDPFEQASTANDGTVLAATRSNVYRIAASGAATVVTAIPSGGDAELDRNAMGFALKSSSSVTLYDRQGTALVDAAAGESDYVKVYPGAQRMLIANVRSDMQTARVLGAQTVGAGFAATMPSPGMLLSRLSNGYLHYSNGLQTIQLTQSGAESARIDLPLRHLEVNDNGDRMIGEVAHRGVSIVHVANGLAGDAQTLSEPVWDVAMSPDGVFSAVTSQTGVHVFATGRLLGSYGLPVRVASQVAISNKGELLIGGKTSDGKLIVLLLARNGTELWREVGDAETHAYRPDVRFYPQGDGFVVRGTSALKSYNISRSP